MGGKASKELVSVLNKAYEKLKDGPMMKRDLVKGMGYACNSPDAIITKFERQGMLLWEDAGMVGRLEK